MLPAKSDNECGGEAPARLSKAKRRRLRKKRLHQGPQEDGGEACAELPPDTELPSALTELVTALIPPPDTAQNTSDSQLPCALTELVTALIPPPDTPQSPPEQQAILGSITITPVCHQQCVPPSSTPVESRPKHKKCQDQTDVKLSIESTTEWDAHIDNQVVENIISVKTVEIINMESTKKKTPQKNPSPQKQSSTKKSPKEAPSKDDRAEKKHNTPTTPDSKMSKSSSQSSEPKLAAPVVPAASEVAAASTQGAAGSIEKTREEIMAERKAKKAEKAAKKGKTGKENSQPSQEKTEVKSVEHPTKPAKEVAQNPPQEKERPVTVTETKPEIPQAQNKPEEKSKAALKEERRLKQEAQRAAKAAAAKGADATSEPKKPPTAKPAASADGKPAAAVAGKPKSSKPQMNFAKLLSHLQRDPTPPSTVGIHPAIIKLGLQFSQHQVAGSNARVVALMRAMKKVVEDYETPAQSELRRDLEARMEVYMTYLDRCRPTSVSMTSAMRALKNRLQLLPASLPDAEAKRLLVAAIDGQEDGFINKMELDCRSVSFNVLEKIKHDDVILTYGCSSLVQRVLMEAQSSGRNFRVVVVGARPWREAEKMLRVLTGRGLRCSYLLISAVSSIMKEVTKVLLGAHAIMANGYVMARAGSSQVALIAHSLNVPVIVCCETYKFCERVQTDAFIYNELGSPEGLIPGVQSANLTQCVLTYDVTPPELVSTVVTEVSMLPCSSVPVVLHMQSSETRLKRRTTTEPAKP